jgi:hypothetical protein
MQRHPHDPNTIIDVDAAVATLIERASTSTVHRRL